MMFREQYQKDFDAINPEPKMINQLSARLKYEMMNSRPPGRYTFRQAAVWAAVAVVVCVAAFVAFYPSPVPSNSLSVVAYAADNENKKITIGSGIKVELPFGQISRGEAHSSTENGKPRTTYDAWFEHGNINVMGDNITSVTYSCVNEELYYSDLIMRKQMQKRGELVFCTLIIKKSVLPYPDGNEFKRLWNAGYFDDVKAQYFKNRSTDIDNYRVQFNQTGEQLKKDEWTVEIEPDYKGRYPYEQCGKEVTAKYYKESGGDSLGVSWVPWNAIDIVAEFRPVDFSKLPGDTITITARFADGQTATRVLKLSFDKSGKLMAELME